MEFTNVLQSIQERINFFARPSHLQRFLQLVLNHPGAIGLLKSLVLVNVEPYSFAAHSQLR